MRRGLKFLILFASLLFWPAARLRPTAAQATFQAVTHYAVTVYSGPDRADHIVGILTPQAQVIVEARSGDQAWVLGRSPDGKTRGWIESRHLEFAPGASLPDLPVSSEIMFVLSTSPHTGAYSQVDLDVYPIVPADLGQAHDIYQVGRIRGMNPNVVSKIGDCITDSASFLDPFGQGQYNLGSYGYLQDVIQHFSASLALNSLSAYDGLVTNAALDPVFANPLACEPGESPLRCEYRIHQPSVAVIMFGAQDLLFTPPDQFDRNLRQIVHETIQAGVIPILSTFPGNHELWPQSIQYNQIVVQIALDYRVPLMNLWRALEPLPNNGLNDDGRHLSHPITSAGDLTEPNLERGYPMRNLLTLQALDMVWRGAMY